MRILYNEIHTRVDTYIFEINCGGETGIKPWEDGDKVKIIFKDEKFFDVEWKTFRENRSRRAFWIIVQSISEKIKELEKEYYGPSLMEGTYSEKDFYNLLMHVYHKGHGKHKRLDIIKKWAQEAIEKYREGKLEEYN